MSEALLSVSGLVAGYGATEVLRGIDLEVAAGEIVAVLGSNGAGKSTLNRVISGVLRATHGSVRFAGGAIEREKPATIVARGAHPRAGGALHLSQPDDQGKSRSWQLPAGAASGGRGIGSEYLRSFRGSPSAARSAPARSQAASSRCWRSGAG